MTEQLHNQRDPIEDDEIDLMDLFGRLWAGKFTIAAFVFSGAVIGLFLALNTPPTYQAQGTIQLEENAGQLGLPQGIADLSGSSPRAATEVEILKSGMVVGRAVSRLNLDWSATPLPAPFIGHLLATRDLPLPDWDSLRAYARPGDAIRLDLLEVPPAWVGMEIRLTSEGGDRFVLALPTGGELQGEVGETLLAEDVGLSLRVGALSAAPGRVFILRQFRGADAVASVSAALGVSEQGGWNSGILRLTYKSSSPELARRTLDAIAQAYLSQNAERSVAEAESGLAFVESQLPVARAAVQEAEVALNDVREAEQAIDLSAEGNAQGW